eukprot:11206328-Lingulodinium_polyedra.AAC.1
MSRRIPPRDCWPRRSCRRPQDRLQVPMMLAIPTAPEADVAAAVVVAAAAAVAAATPAAPAAAVA